MPFLRVSNINFHKQLFELVVKELSGYEKLGRVPVREVQDAAALDENMPVFDGTEYSLVGMTSGLVMRDNRTLLISRIRNSAARSDPGLKVGV